MDGGGRLCLALGGLAAGVLAAVATPVAVWADPGHASPPGKANGLHQNANDQGSTVAGTAGVPATDGGNGGANGAANRDGNPGSNDGGNNAQGGGGNSASSNDAASRGDSTESSSADLNGGSNRGEDSGGANNGHHYGKDKHAALTPGTKAAATPEARGGGVVLSAILGLTPSSAPTSGTAGASTPHAQLSGPGGEAAPPPPVVGPTTSTPPPVAVPEALTAVRLSVLAVAVIVLGLTVVMAVRAATRRGGTRR